MSEFIKIIWGYEQEVMESLRNPKGNIKQISHVIRGF
jgi:hypothetical protein